MKKRWKRQQLGELCDILDSQRKPITKRDRIAGQFPYYGAPGVVDYVNDFIFDEPLVLVGEDGAKWDSCEDTAFRIEGKCRVSNHAHVLRPQAKVKLAGGKERAIQHMVSTSFWHPDGTPMSAQQFIEALFGKLPEFFTDEQELRELRSLPETRRQLLNGLAEKTVSRCHCTRGPQPIVT